MEHRQLGADGPRVPVLGFGAWPIGGGMGKVEERQAIATIHAALDHGITLIDTAQAYRSSEEIVGKALKGSRRDGCFLATKASRDYSPAGIRAAVEDSLRALDTEVIDLYQIHNYKPEYPIRESMETLVKLREEGKIRYLGVSNYRGPQIREALEHAPVVSNQVRYNVFDRRIEEKDLPFCAEKGVGILVHSPLAKGLLTGKYRPGHQFPPEDERSEFPRFKGEVFARYLAIAEQLEVIARRKGLTLVQLAIAWTLRLPAVSCVLVGAKDPGQVQDHLGAVGVSFSAAEQEQIDSLSVQAPS